MKVGRRRIVSGKEYDPLFPKAKGTTRLIKHDGTVSDTVELMKKVIRETLHETYKISKVLRAKTAEQTCKNIWNFCFRHLQYKKDEFDKEQVRSPARTWHDRHDHLGLDCDCVSVFICSILQNCNLRYKIRLTKYGSTSFEHVYPVAIIGNKEIIMDTVVHQYNYEVPYTEKKDISMDLEFLNGFDDDSFDEFDYVDQDDLEGLEGKQERMKRKYNRQEKRKDRIDKYTNLPLKAKIGKVLNVVNKVNPATALLRAGILASMNTNLFKVASKLRYSYWTKEQALANNMEIDKYFKLVSIRQKLEKIFFGSGGKIENLKKSILSGRGNRDRKVLNGLGEVIGGTYRGHDLIATIGADTYYDEFSDVTFNNGVNGLGEPATGTAIAAASGVVATIAGLIKTLGDLFKKGSEQNAQEKIVDNTYDQEDKSNPVVVPPTENLPSIRTLPESSNELVPAEIPVAEEIPDDDSELPSNENEKKSTNKKGIVQWVKDNQGLAVGIGLALIGGTVLAVRAIKNSKKKKSLNGFDQYNDFGTVEGLNGVKTRRKRKTTKSKPKKKKVIRKKRPTTKRKKVKTRKYNSKGYQKIELM